MKDKEEKIHKLVEQFGKLQKKKYRFRMVDYVNEETGEKVSIERKELLVADPNDEDKEILKQICEGVKEATTDDLKAIWDDAEDIFSADGILPVLQELSDRGDVYASDKLNYIDRLWELVHKGDEDDATLSAAAFLAHRYAYGDEEHGIFVDKKKAKELYDIAKWDGYDPNEESDFENEVIEGDYYLQGDPSELDKVEKDLKELAEKHGILDNGLGGMYVPFDFLFKKLVGSPYYKGNITKMERLAANNLFLHSEGDTSEPLLYALRKYYPNLEIKQELNGD